MINITKFPVVIFSSPRTGSTALVRYLQHLYPENNCFCEPDLRELERFLDYGKQHDNFIVKLMARNLHLYPNELIFSPANFFIRIRRRSIVDQVASNYIARERNLWYYQTNNSVFDTPIHIDPLKITENIAIVSRYNAALHKVNVKFDLDLYYEDLPRMVVPGHIITPKPLNYNELKSEIAALLFTNGIPKSPG